MALESATLLDRLVFSHGVPTKAEPRGAEQYCRELLQWHESWQELIDYFYDGRILRMYEAGSKLAMDKEKWNPAKIMERHVQRVIQAMASGAATRSGYNRKLIEFTARHLIWDVPDAEFFSVKQ